MHGYQLSIMNCYNTSYSAFLYACISQSCLRYAGGIKLKFCLTFIVKWDNLFDICLLLLVIMINSHFLFRYMT